MPINEVTQALGSWSVVLREDTPRSILDQLKYYGHICVHAARQFHPERFGDELLATARYTGVLRGRQFTGSQGQFSEDSGSGSPLAQTTATTTSVQDANLIYGSGMAYWLGDEDDKGPVIEPPGTVLTDVLFTEGVRALLPASRSIREGTFHPMVGSWSGSYVFTTPRRALSDFVGYFSDQYGEAEWRVNHDGTLDAGSIHDLYVTEPRAIIARKATGQDVNLRGLRGTAQTAEDAEDFSTRVIVLAEGTGPTVATGEADLPPGENPYVDLFGNPVTITRMISQEGTDASNAPASAVLNLNRFKNLRRSLDLSSDEVDMKGLFGVGDYVWLYDPDTGLEDLEFEVVFQGRRIYPTKLRITEFSWPVIAGMGVCYRRPDGGWLDLTDYVYFEQPNSVDVVVGDLSRTLLQGAAGTEAVGSRPKPDSSIPAAPSWILPFSLSAYQSTTGITRAQASLRWHRPLNTDGTAVIDGDHYEIRWRTSAHQILPVSWGYLQQADLRWIDLVQWNGMLPAAEGPWTYTAVGFDQSEFLLSDLTPGVPYDIQIRAVDSATPPNFGDWSEPIETFETLGDPFPPSEPAPPSVASSLIAVQVTHLLGKSSGGTFNLEADLHHLEVHASFSPTFAPDDSTLLGKMICNDGTLQSGVAVVGTFQIAITTDVWIKVVAVDDAGNRSGASSGVQSTATLIDDAHISDLTVTKVTAGLIQTTWLVGGTITTGVDGARAGMDAFGFFAYDNANQQTFAVDAQTGSVAMIGTLDTAAAGSRVRIAPAEPSHILQAPGMYLWAVGSNNPALIYAVPEGADPTMVPSSIAVTSSLDSTNNRVGTMYVRDSRAYLGMRTYVGPDPTHPHGSYLENGSYFASKPNRAELAIVGQVGTDDEITYDGGFMSVLRDTAYFGFDNATHPQSFLAWDSTASLQHKGRWFAKASSTSLGTFIGTFNPGAVAGGVIASFGATQVDTHGGVASAQSVGIASVAVTTTQVSITYTANSASVCSGFIFGLDR